jgi:hypothetical protein
MRVEGISAELVDALAIGGRPARFIARVHVDVGL